MITQRNIALCIVLSIVTCGIYGIYWFVCITNETNEVANTPGTSGGIAFLLCLITCNIYGLYWAYKQGEKIDAARESRGLQSNSNSVVYLILMLFVPVVAWALMQNELNNMA